MQRSTAPLPGSELCCVVWHSAGTVLSANCVRWQVPDQHKQNLLNALGRHFVMGQTQDPKQASHTISKMPSEIEHVYEDMDGAAARHEPFKNDPSTWFEVTVCH